MAKQASLLLIHLDKIRGLLEWKDLKTEWLNTFDEVLAANMWIVDHAYTRDLERRLPAANTFILLNWPTHLSFEGHCAALSQGQERHGPAWRRGFRGGSFRHPCFIW
jgi:adenylate kinase family enzyme